MSQHALTRHPLVLRRVTVLRVHDLTPRMRRITVGGPQLAAFTTDDGLPMPAFTTPAFDDHVKLVLTTDGDVAAALPVQRARSIDWPPAPNRAGRDYTPRRFDAAAGELDLDVVLHGAGPAQDWARTAAPGDPLWFAGPKSSVVLPGDLDWVLLAGDETALPAIGRFLDERPVDVPVQVVVETGDPSARQDLPVRDGDVLRWVGPGRLADAVRALDRWPGTPYAWVAGESRALVPLRRWLRQERQVPPDHSDVTGYWHAAPAAGGAHPAPDVELLLDPVPWAVTRAALECGLLPALGSRPVLSAELSDRTGLDVGALGVLAAQLAVHGLVRQDGAGLLLGPVGEEVLGDEHLRDELFGPGLAARTLTALAHLPEALRTGQPAWVLAHGRSLAADLDDDPRLVADAVAAAGSFAFVAGGVPDLPSWAGARSAVVRGPGAAALLHSAAERGALPEVVVTGPPALRERLAGELGDLPVPVTDDPGVADVVVSTLETGSRTDDELGVLLAGLTGTADRLLVVDVLALTGPGGPEVAAEHALHTLVRTGRPPRTAAELIGIAGAAGWRPVGHTALGWDHDAFEFLR